MKRKVCSKCHKRKNIKEFYKNRNFKDGHIYECKKCANLRITQWAKKNPNKTSQYHRTWYTKNQKKSIVKARVYRKFHPIKIRYTKRNCYLKHRKERLEYNKIYQKLNRKQIQKYYNLKRKNDINYKIACNLRSRIRLALKRNSKSAKTIDLLGCSIGFLKKYLKKKLKKGMSWKNYGLFGWHIDHIRPCASFDLSKPEEQKKCFNFKNLQPLWAEENIRKGDKYEE